MDGAYSTHSGKRNVYRLLTGKPETASVVLWSEFLVANPEVLGSIPGANKFSA
jgi:hypothetical protein